MIFKCNNKKYEFNVLYTAITYIMYYFMFSVFWSYGLIDVVIAQINNIPEDIAFIILLILTGLVTLSLPIIVNINEVNN